MAQDGALRLVEQGITPIQRGTQRLLAAGRRPTTADQEVDAVVQAFQDLVDAERSNATSSELYRQGRDASL